MPMATDGSSSERVLRRKRHSHSLFGLAFLLLRDADEHPSVGRGERRLHDAAGPQHEGGAQREQRGVADAGKSGAGSQSARIVTAFGVRSRNTSRASATSSAMPAAPASRRTTVAEPAEEREEAVVRQLCGGAPPLSSPYFFFTTPDAEGDRAHPLLPSVERSQRPFESVHVLARRAIATTPGTAPRAGSQRDALRS